MGSSAISIGVNSNGVIYVLRRSGEILRSTNFGNSFQTINNIIPLEYRFLKDIAFNTEDEIYISTVDGLYVSTSDGNDWIMIDDSDISKHIEILEFDNNNILYAGTTGAAVFRSSETLTGINEKKDESNYFLLSQNYPNPFNPSTTIKYEIPEKSFVTIKVYDVLGNEIAILVNEEKSAGNYEVEFNAEWLSSGIYFYQLQAQDLILIKKMLILK
jgi:hypothetical protein